MPKEPYYILSKNNKYYGYFLNILQKLNKRTKPINEII